MLVLRDLTLYRYGISLNKLFDYLATGMSIIFVGHSANNPVYKAQCDLTVLPRDPEALAEAIIKLSELPPQQREAMDRRGHEYVEEHHDIVKLAEKLEGAFGRAA